MHYGGVNEMMRHWASRTHLYKPSIVYTDDVTVSSTVADTAMEANAGMLGRQFSISYQGKLTSALHYMYSKRSCAPPGVP